MWAAFKAYSLVFLRAVNSSFVVILLSFISLAAYASNSAGSKAFIAISNKSVYFLYMLSLDNLNSSINSSNAEP